MNKPDLNLSSAIFLGLLLMAIIGSVTFLVLYVYAIVTYGDTPMSDCPVWVWWILNGGLR